MSGDPEHIPDTDLAAYADGMLDGERRRRVEERLRRDAEAWERVRDYITQNAELRALYGPVFNEPVPSRLGNVVERFVRRRRRVRVAASAASAAAVILGAGVLGWWISHVDNPGGWSAKAFLESAAATTEGLPARTGGFPAGEGAPDPLTWLSREVGVSVQPPDLSARGFSLTGGRLVSVGGSRAVELRYEKAPGETIRLFITPRWRDKMTPPRTAESGGVSAAYRLEGPLAYAVVGRIDRRELLEILTQIGNASRGPLGVKPVPARDNGPPIPVVNQSAGAENRPGL